jgi:hypothetical protein
MANPEIVLDAVRRRYEVSPFDGYPVEDRYFDIYKSEDPRLRGAFAWFHSELNRLFDHMNLKRTRGGHYNAAQSKDLIDRTREIGVLQRQLSQANITATLEPRYAQTLERCRGFLVASGGGPIPQDFGEIELIEFDPVFASSLTTVVRREHVDYPLKMIGRGSYAHVYKFHDEAYKTTFALKRANADLNERELIRFKAEYEVLKALDYPYVLTVFGYDTSGPSYTMEFCQFTLEKFMERYNSELPNAQRLRMVEQLLWALKYLGTRRILHRDLSYTNVLVKYQDLGMITIKLSDFGLHKTDESTLTHTGSEMKGSLRDPQAVSFKEFELTNEIYAVGFIIGFILTGRKSVPRSEGPIRDIVLKCVNTNVAERYQSIDQILTDVAQLRQVGSPASRE